MMKTRKKSWKRIQKRKVSVEELNELSIVVGNDGNPEPRCSISNIIISTVLVPLVSFSYFLPLRRPFFPPSQTSNEITGKSRLFPVCFA